MWGHDTAKATKKLVTENGGEIVDEILVPQGTRDFSAILLKLQQKAPNVVAAAVGGDDLKALRAQVSQMKLGEKYAWINNQQDWPDIYGLPRTDLFGVFGTTWYQGLDLPGVKEFNAKYLKANADSKIKTPGQRLLQRLLGDSLAARSDRADQDDQQPRRIKELEQLKISAADAHAASRRVHEPEDASAAADHLPGHRQPRRRKSRTSCSRSSATPTRAR